MPIFDEMWKKKIILQMHVENGERDTHTDGEWEMQKFTMLLKVIEITLKCNDIKHFYFSGITEANRNKSKTQYT